MLAMFWLPYWSSWEAPITTWRRPAQSVSKTRRKGIQPSTTLSVPSRAILPATKKASPSDTSRSGSMVARARRAPSIGIIPIPLAKISPSPRKASDRATTQTSASSATGDRPLVVGLAALQIPRRERGPRLGVGGCGRVALLERLVPAVVRVARREVRAPRRLDHPVDHRAVDRQRVERALGAQLIG